MEVIVNQSYSLMLTPSEAKAFQNIVGLNCSIPELMRQSGYGAERIAEIKQHMDTFHAAITNALGRK